MYGRTTFRLLAVGFLLASPAVPAPAPTRLAQALAEAVADTFAVRVPGLAVVVAPLAGDTPEASYRRAVEEGLARTGAVRVVPGDGAVLKVDALPDEVGGVVEGSFRVRGERLVCYLALVMRADGARPWVLVRELSAVDSAFPSQGELGELVRRNGMPIGIVLVALSAVLATLGLAGGRALPLHPVMAEAVQVLDRANRSLWWVRAAAEYRPELAAIREEMDQLCRELAARPEHQVRVEGLGFKEEERRAVLYFENRIAHQASEVGQIAAEMGETLRAATGSPELARQQLDGVRRRLADMREALERRRTTLGTLLA